MNLQKDIINSSIVVVFKPVSIEPGLKANVESMLQQPIVGWASPDPDIGLNLISSRNQISINLTQSRLQVKDDSGIEPGSKPIADLVHRLLILLSTNIIAFGFNYEVEFVLSEGTGSGNLIASSLLKMKDNLDLKIVGAGVRIFYLKDKKKCNLLLEPKGQDYKSNLVYARINVHEDISELPNQETLASSFRKEYEDFIRVCENFFKTKEG